MVIVDGAAAVEAASGTYYAIWTDAFALFATPQAYCCGGVDDARMPANERR